jgi:hypothetical protein
MRVRAAATAAASRARRADPRVHPNPVYVAAGESLAHAPQQRANDGSSPGEDNAPPKGTTRIGERRGYGRE